MPGTAYTFTVSATNFLGVSGTPVAVAITKADKQIPYVITPGNGPEKRITGSRNYIFMPFASGGVPGRFAYVNGQCVPFKYNLPMNYTWQQMTGPIINVSSLATNYQNSFRASALQIPGSVFQIGVDYEFMVSCPFLCMLLSPVLESYTPGVIRTSFLLKERLNIITGKLRKRSTTRRRP